MHALEGTGLSDLRQGNGTLTITANQAFEATSTRWGMSGMHIARAERFDGRRNRGIP